MSEKILIIDDEQDIADLLEVYLKNENYVVYKFYCATDAMSCIESGDIDLAILDIMLPDMNGFSLCQLIRKKYTYPIIMLTAKIEETDKITGLTFLVQVFYHTCLTNGVQFTRSGANVNWFCVSRLRA